MLGIAWRGINEASASEGTENPQVSEAQTDSASERASVEVGIPAEEFLNEAQ